MYLFPNVGLKSDFGSPKKVVVERTKEHGGESGSFT